MIEENNKQLIIENVKLGDHLCSIYKNKEEQFSCLLPYFKKGLGNHQKCIYIVDENSKEEVISEFEKHKINIQEQIKSNQFVLLTKKETYLKNGFFDPNKMIDLLKETQRKALEEGYSGLRVSGEMTWVLEGVKGSEKLIEYESKLNNFFPNSQSSAICQYNETKFEPKILIEVIHTHPFIIIYGKLYKNEYYVPASYLDEKNKLLPENEYDMIKNEIIKK